MMKNNLTIACYALGLIFSSSAASQVCFDTITETTPIINFTVNNNGTATDNSTGIMWYRCSVGQTWDSQTSSCLGGNEQVDWQQALKLANDATEAGFTDWQLPSVKELSTLVERRCVDAAINSTIFPNTVAENYWTNTSGVGSTSQAWAVAFYSGKTNLRSKGSDVHLRLMRYVK